MIRTRLLAAALALLVVALSPTAAAKEATAEAWQGESRQVTIGASSDQATLSSARTSDLGTDTITYHIDAMDASVQARLVATAPNATDLSWTLRAATLIEYSDDNQDGRVGPGDTLHRTLPVASLQHATEAPPVLAGDARIAARFTVPAPERDDDALLPDGGDLNGDGTLTVTVVASATDAPTTADLSVGFVAPTHTTPGSRFLLQATLLGPMGLHDATSFQVTHGPFAGALAWPDITATWSDIWHLDIPLADHDTTTGHSTFAYTPPEIIQAAVRAIAGNPLLFGTALLATGLVVGTPMWRRMREAS